MVTVLFPSEPFNPRRVDPDFAREVAAVEALDLPFGLVDLETLQYEGDAARAVRYAPTGAGLAVYRGWMLKPHQYTDLYAALARRDTLLINDPEEYRHARYLPEAFESIAPHTARTTWIPTRNVPGDSALADVLEPFGDSAVLVKDYVKSRKHEWAEACYIPSASDRSQVERVVRRFLELQGDDLNEGLVFREYVELQPIGLHPKSGMPLSEEYRSFVLNGLPFFTAEYWEDVAYAPTDPPLEQFAAALRAVRSRFFTADVARTVDGRWMIIELGDGQVAGLPEHADPIAFYRALITAIEETQ